jgi:hypothetical protein
MDKKKFRLSRKLKQEDEEEIKLEWEVYKKMRKKDEPIEVLNYI